MGTQKQDALMIVFFVAWLICGCSTDTMLDEPVSGVIALIAMIVAVACAWTMGHKRD